MCSDNVFAIIVSDVFKLIENFKSYNFFPHISLRKFSKSSFKSCNFCKTGVLLPPSTQSLVFGNKKSIMMHVL